MEKSNLNLEDKSVQQLDQLLRAELQKETPDENSVLEILKVLREMESEDQKQVGAPAEESWEHYKNNIVEYSKPKRNPGRVWLIRCAVIIAVVGMLLVTIPQAVEADSVFGKMIRWAERVFETFTQSSSQNEYVYRTNHPGLQELYDKVTELGVTQPVVPMWIPKGLQTEDMKVLKSPAKERAFTRFTDEEQWVSYTIDIYNTEKKSNYAKDNDQLQEFEIVGVVHYILSNDSSWSAVWIVDNVECTIATNCGEDILCEILCSIYNMEGE